MKKTTDNPLQINPIEASGPIHFLKSMSRISNTSILLQPSPTEISPQLENKGNCSEFYYDPSQENVNEV